MKKLTIDDLCVESFATSAPGDGRGSVVAHDSWQTECGCGGTEGGGHCSDWVPCQESFDYTFCETTCG